MLAQTPQNDRAAQRGCEVSGNTRDGERTDLVRVRLLLADSQAVDQVFIAVEIRLLKVIQESTTLAYEFQKTTARVVILLVGLEMLGQVVDPLAKYGHLHLW